MPVGAIQRWQLPDDLTQQWLWQAGDVINVGDAMIDAYAAGVGASGVARPAGVLTSLGSEALDQAQVSPYFVGFSQQTVNAAESNSGVYPYPIVIRTEGVVLISIPSQVVTRGQLLGVYSSGSAINPQLADACGNAPNLSLGGLRVIMPGIGSGAVNWSLPTTQVVAAYISNQAEANPTFGANGNLFGSQRSSVATLLVDATQTLLVSSSVFLKMIPTSARTVTLPLEKVSAGYGYIFSNQSAGSFSVTFLGSANSIQGNAVVPQNKVATLTCDGVNWYSSVSN